MSKKTVSEKAISSLLVDVGRFDMMTPAQKAAFRARCSRYLANVTDPEYTAILTAVQNRVGKAATKRSTALTIDGLEEEFDRGLDYGNSRTLAAFKAKATRMFNKASANEDNDTADRVKAIMDVIAESTKALARERIMTLAVNAGLVQFEGEEE